ncbi:BTAD domain-containing putative transcriptional regulator [Streptomyces sp. NBC_00102]|uniref:AfsR/SARP family transcriptional regulator n=1 Tax=Streptomyces sp. NBC_00102 TaxID=2975652 RepID=UPI00224DCD2B|nr:BTAD domain-containing putative transcriptional regulator [Streptomyces sp. NBC_00102]MCX5398091.1 winged helix-turn-helix domain-containing protein [Streptomyces sp. NBC_00102]
MDFLVLGPVEVRESGMPVRLRGMRRRRLLALLLLNARYAVSMDALVDELWQDPPASARHQVHNAIRDLRAALAGSEGAGLITVDVGYRLDVPADAVDAHRFTDGVRAARAARREGRDVEAMRLLQAAVDLWRGDAFAGIDCPAVAAVAAGLDEQRLTAVEELMELRLASGETGSLVAELFALTARHPLRDALRGSLMLALYRGGRQADALAVYDEGRRLLADELGLEPGPQLRRLQTEILADAPRVQPRTPVTDRLATGRPVIDLLATGRPATDLPATDRPGDPFVTDRPAADHTATDRPADDRPATVRPAADRPAADRPATDRPGRDNYLPRTLPDFTGRTTELALLDRAVDGQSAGAPRTVVIDGMGGIGKTALAVHFAHRRTADHPDGQYYVDLHGFSPARAPLTPEEALGVLLRSDGAAPDALPAGLAERSAMWRSRLAGRSALLVLDNAADAAQVDPLLPGTGDTLTLITTRRKLTATDGALSLPLGALAPADAETLFRRIAGEACAGSSLDRTVALCGHHPLALRIAATRLRDRPSWTVPDVTARLRTSAGRTAFLRTADRDLMSVLALSYGQLSHEAQEFTRALALHPATVHDIPQACAATGLAPFAVESLFDTLLDHNLADEPSPAHLTIPPLLRDCAHTVTFPAHDATRRLTAVA